MAVAVMAIASSYYWTGFPFDNLCVEESSPVDFTGDFDLQPYPSPYPRFGGTFSTSITTATVSSGDFNYVVCSQDFTGHWPKVPFPFVPTRAKVAESLDPYAYMTDDQILSTTYFGWAAFAFMLVILAKYIASWYSQYQAIYKGGYVPVGESQGKPFSEELSRSAYIPQVYSKSFAFPLIACQVDNIDTELFDFTDPSRSHLYYDLTNDAEKLVSASENNAVDESTFTVVKSWPADKKKDWQGMTLPPKPMIQIRHMELIGESDVGELETKSLTTSPIRHVTMIGEVVEDSDSSSLSTIDW